MGSSLHWEECRSSSFRSWSLGSPTASGGPGIWSEGEEWIAALPLVARNDYVEVFCAVALVPAGAAAGAATLTRPRRFFRGGAPREQHGERQQCQQQIFS